MLQFKIRFIVIELLTAPTLRVMAALTLITQLIVMNVIFLVTFDADRRRISEFVLRLVAAAALSLQMLPFKHIIGALMIEAIFVHPDDRRLCTLVLGVTFTAVRLKSFLTPAMKTFTLTDISCNVFMAIQAELFLRGLAQAHMALLAILLKFLVP